MRPTDCYPRVGFGQARCPFPTPALSGLGAESLVAQMKRMQAQAAHSVSGSRTRTQAPARRHTTTSSRTPSRSTAGRPTFTARPTTTSGGRRPSAQRPTLTRTQGNNLMTRVQGRFNVGQRSGAGLSPGQRTGQSSSPGKPIAPFSSGGSGPGKSSQAPGQTRDMPFEQEGFPGEGEARGRGKREDFVDGPLFDLDAGGPAPSAGGGGGGGGGPAPAEEDEAVAPEGGATSSPGGAVFARSGAPSGSTEKPPLQVTPAAKVGIGIGSAVALGFLFGWW